MNKCGRMAPCYGCTDRHVACHSECDRYKAWHADERSAWQKEIQCIRAGNDYVAARKRLPQKFESLGQQRTRLHRAQQEINRQRKSYKAKGGVAQ